MNKFNYLAIFLLLFSCNRIHTTKTGLEGKPLPSFEYLTIDSSNSNSARIPPGKPIVLIYFSPTCPYCRAQIQDIVDNIAKLQDCRFYLFSASDISAIKNFYSKYHLKDYPNITVGADNSFEIGNYFKINVVPYNAIYSSNKILKSVIVGRAATDDIKKTTAELIQ